MLRGRCASTRRAADTRAEVVLSVDREANGSAVTFTGKSHVLSVLCARCPVMGGTSSKQAILLEGGTSKSWNGLFIGIDARFEDN